MFPVQECGPGYADAPGEGTLRQAGAGTDCCDVDFGGNLDLADRCVGGFAVPEGEGLLEAAEQAVSLGHGGAP